MSKSRNVSFSRAGMKAYSLYISQVKRKCGLDVGNSYNKPKTEDTEQPQCPPDKEIAIMDALKHFGIMEQRKYDTGGSVWSDSMTRTGI